MKQLLIIVWSMCSGLLWAQHEDVWVLGDYGLDFTTNPPAIVPMRTTVFNEAGASVCDRNGRLLFYTDGTTAWNRNFQVMDNGTALSNGWGTGSTSQGTIIVPVPEVPDQYYIFSLTSVEYGIHAGKLLYSKVDMSLNGGSGAVVAGQKALLLDSNLTEKLTAVPGNRCNTWLIVRARDTGTFRSFDITASGIRPDAVMSRTGTLHHSLYLLGTLTPSPDHHKILSASVHLSGGGLECFDFDPSSGILSHPVVLDNRSVYYSACFSPDQSKVYANTHYLADSLVYQFDLSTGDPGFSRTAIAAIESFGKIKLAPDNKVYFPRTGGALAVINAPNRTALNCDVDTAGIVFPYGAALALALPNIIPVMLYDTAVSRYTTIPPYCWPRGHDLKVSADGYDFRWSNNASTAVNRVDLPGRYWVSYKTAPCIFHADTFYVPEPQAQLPLLDIEPSCKAAHNGSARAIAADSNMYRYTWLDNHNNILSYDDSVGNLPAGRYALRVHTVSNCDTILYFELPENNFPVSFVLEDSLVCTGQRLKLHNTSDPYYTAFNWRFGDGIERREKAPEHQYTRPGNYRIVLSANAGRCSDSFSLSLTVDTPVAPFSFYIEKDTFCTGTEVLFRPRADITTLSLTWLFDENNSLLESAPGPKSHAFDHAGLKVVQLTGHFRACPDQVFTDTVSIYPVPVIDLGADTSLCFNGLPFNLYNRAGSGGEGDYYRWNTGDTTKEVKVSHPGKYTLDVITKLGGCHNSSYISITKGCHADIPNAFTPNGDGVNDHFFPRQLLTRDTRTFRMQVWNRWGQLVFESHDKKGRGWDGRYLGGEQLPGSYVYHIDLLSDGGDSQHYEGNVTLIR